MKQNAFLRRWLPLSGILMLAWLLRLMDVMTLPLFSDETLHITRTHAILAGETFAGLDQNKWLYGYLLSAFNPTGVEGPWVARWLAALWGVLSVAGCAALARRLLGRRTEAWAALTYAVLPLAVFHERMALTDPQMSALALLATLLGLMLARRPRLWVALLLAACLLAARLTKMAALPAFGLPFAAVFLFTLFEPGRPWPERRQRAVAAFGLSALAVALTFAAAAGVLAIADAQGVAPARSVEASASNTILSLPLAEVMPRLLNDVTTLADLYWRYVTPLGLALIGLGIGLGLLKRDGYTWRVILFLLLPAFGFCAVVLIADRPTATDEIATRYLLLNAPALCVLVALGWHMLTERWPGGRRWLPLGLAAFLAYPLWFNLTLSRNPRALPLAAYDRRVYIDGSVAGYEFIEMIGAVLAEHQRVGHVNGYVTGAADRWANAYLGSRSGGFLTYFSKDYDQRRQISHWLADGEGVYFIETVAAERIGPHPHGTNIEQIGSFTSFSSQLNLYRVTGARQQVAEDVYNHLAGQARFMQGDYEALAAALEAQPPSRVIVFPSGHAGALAQQTDLLVWPLRIDTWPMTAEAISYKLGGLHLPDEPQQIDFVVVNEAETDSQRLLLVALQRRLYMQDRQFYGLLNHMRYLSGPQAPQFQPVEAVFEGGIALEEAAILDAAAQPGGAIRLALRWQSPVPVADSFSVFTHLVDAEGNIAAQRDGIPGSGLFPLTSWQPGEPVEDRYAISLPPGIAPGRYTLWVGLYQPGSGLRLRLASGPEGSGSDYAALGQIEVRQ